MRRCFAVLLVVFFASLSLVSLVTVVQAQAPSVVLRHNTAVTAAHEPITVTVSAKNAHESLTPTVMAEDSFTLPTRLKLIGSVFRLGTAETHQLQPLIIEVRYSAVDTVDEQRLTLVYYEPLAEKWLPLKTVVDVINHVATAEALAQDTVYALVMSPEVVSLPPNAIIVDDLDTSHFAQYGNALGWRSVSGPTNYYYLGHMYWTSNTLSALDNYAIWTPSSLNPGPYQVYAFIDWDNATTQKARYQIVHNGQTTVYTVNQNIYYAEWVSLGTYQFGSATGSNYVRLEDVTGEAYLSKRVGFDAIAFVPNRVYLPLVLKNYPPMKSKAGIHLGNRSEDWNATMLNAIDGSKPGGIWPAMITVLSDQVYNLGRPQTGDAGNPYCHIVNVDPWRDQTNNPRAVYNYLKRAAQAGVKVIIRVNPSPGNFQDWNDPTRSNHHLTSTDLPEGGGYCGYNGHQHAVRDVKDIAIEMKQIHDANMRDGWQEYAFEPANEPNTEWYDDDLLKISRRKAEAWREMDTYFSALYDQAKALDPSIRILTPPMAQSAYAEPFEINSPTTTTDCDPRFVVEADRVTPAGSGYDNMKATYTTKNDGFSWHNYWNQGREAWGNCPPTHHVYKVFPAWMKDQIRNSGKPSFITESDLSSPGQGMGNPLLNKNDPTTTADSIQQFIAAEVWGQNVVIWLINNNFADKPEYDWHEAFNDGGTPRGWFTEWWQRSGQ